MRHFLWLGVLGGISMMGAGILDSKWLLAMFGALCGLAFLAGLTL